MATIPTDNERRTQRNSRAVTLWAFVFAASFLGGHWLIADGAWEPAGATGVALSFLPLLPGLLAFRAYLRFYRESDEMMRQVQTDGIVFGFAAVLLFWGAIQLPEHVWFPEVRASWIVTVMLASFSFGVVRASLRRR